MRGNVCLAAGIVLIAASGVRAGEPAFFTGLGDLAGGRDLSAATGVSADGSVVVGYSDSTLG